MSPTSSTMPKAACKSTGCLPASIKRHLKLQLILIQKVTRPQKNYNAKLSFIPIATLQGEVNLIGSDSCVLILHNIE